MKNRNIVISAADYAELHDLIAYPGNVSARTQTELRTLANELKRAAIVNPNQIPSDVITMNSRVLLHDLDTGERLVFTLVLPAAADSNGKKLSVLAPLGTAMLGHRVGDEFKWRVPSGFRRLKVTRVDFQPEAMLRNAA
ncbi:MAG: nucleoside diphosphate kinase regulator [Chthoniobacterales bacterium]